MRIVLTSRFDPNFVLIVHILGFLRHSQQKYCTLQIEKSSQAACQLATTCASLTTRTSWSKGLYKLNPSLRHLYTKTTSKLFVTGYIWNCGGTTYKSGEKHSCQDLLGLSPLSTLYDVIPRRRFLRITSWSQTKLRR